MVTQYPKISIVTPSYNQGRFVEATILSVLGQSYPNLEYIIMDGGSNDNTLDIIRSYDHAITYWESKPDRGQADAINKGFGIATGDIFAWLNSDDVYLPGTLKTVAAFFSDPSRELVFGNCIHLDESANSAYGSNVASAHASLDITLCDYIIQPACFWTKATWKRVGLLDIGLAYGLDWDWFIRARHLGVHFSPLDHFLAVYRIHSQHKSGTGGEPRIRELSQIYEKYHSTIVAQSYLRLRLGADIQYVMRFFRKTRLNRVFDTDRLLHKLYFGELTTAQFENLMRM